MAPEYLYHASFKSNLPSIQELGLVPNFTDNWQGLSSEQKGIYLSPYPDYAESFCESAPSVPEGIYNSGIVLFQISVRNLNTEHLSRDLNDKDSYIYNQPIDYNRLQLITERK